MYKSIKFDLAGSFQDVYQFGSNFPISSGDQGYRKSRPPSKIKLYIYINNANRMYKPETRLLEGIHIPCTAGSTDSMYVLFDVARKVKIKHVCNVMNIQSSRGQISGHQDAYMSCTQAIVCLLRLYGNVLHFRGCL